MKAEKKYDTEFGEIEFISPDILIVNYHKINRIDVEHFQLITQYRKQIIGERKYYIISDLRKGIITFSTKAKEYVAQDEAIG